MSDRRQTAVTRWARPELAETTVAFAPLWEPDNVDAVTAIIAEMREIDRAEMQAIGLSNDLQAMQMAARSDDVCIAWFRDRPVFCWGTHAAGGMPQCRELWGFGTRHTLRALPGIAEFGYRFWIHRLFRKMGCHRIEVRLPTFAQGSLSWLMNMGARVECRLPYFGNDSANFLQLAFTLDDYRNLIVRPL
jgi:hypothetical protein